MPTVKERIERATRLLQLLPAKERKLALSYIEELAFDTCVDLLLNEDAEELLAEIERFRSGDRLGTVPLKEVCRQLDAEKRTRGK